MRETFYSEMKSGKIEHTSDKTTAIRLSAGGRQPDIRLIALDMDGTLLNEHGVLSEASRKTLERAVERGIHVVIATGRVFSSLPQDVLAVDGIEFAITSNGANVIRLRDRKTLYSNLIEQKALEEIMDIFCDPSIMIEVFFNHDVYAEKRCLDHLEQFGILAEKSQRYTLSTRTPVDSVMELIRRNEPNLENINLIFKDLDRRAEIWNRLEGMDSLMVTSSMQYNLEIGGATTSKADALSHLAGLLGVDREEIMACGDSENDIHMLNFVGLSVAMGNAAAEAKAAADFITGSNSEEGVALAVERFVLQDKPL